MLVGSCVTLSVYLWIQLYNSNLLQTCLLLLGNKYWKTMLWKLYVGYWIMIKKLLL